VFEAKRFGTKRAPWNLPEMDMMKKDLLVRNTKRTYLKGSVPFLTIRAIDTNSAVAALTRADVVCLRWGGPSEQDCQIPFCGSWHIFQDSCENKKINQTALFSPLYYEFASN
jgi:hypothetical protein